LRKKKIRSRRAKQEKNKRVPRPKGEMNKVETKDGRSTRNTMLGERAQKTTRGKAKGEKNPF